MTSTAAQRGVRLRPPTPSKYNGNHENGLQIALHPHRPGVHAYTLAKPGPPPTTAPLCNATTDGLYTGEDLRAPLRRGATDHEKHPSRIGNARVWRDGRREEAA